MRFKLFLKKILNLFAEMEIRMMFNFLLISVLTSTLSMSVLAQVGTKKLEYRESKAAHIQPNIVFILVDDLGWKDVGYHGSSIPTPNLNSLASNGIRLENFHVNPICTPTRASFIMGRPAHRLGLSDNVLAPWSTGGLPPDDITIAQKLKKFGYRTALIGKWHLGHADASQRPLAKGFDSQFGPLLGSIDYFTHISKDSIKIPDLFRNEKPVTVDGYLTDLFAFESITLINSHNFDTPLFLYIPLSSPHSPFQATKRDLAAVRNIVDGTNLVYAAMVHALDRSVGMIVRALKSRGVWENTIFVFASDNGAAAGGNGKGASNAPLRGGKRTNYEGGLRVPAIFSFPRMLKEFRGHRENNLLKVTDLSATFLLAACDKKCAGLFEPDADGIDILALLDGRIKIPEFRVLNLDHVSGAFVYGQYKAIQNPMRIVSSKNNPIKHGVEIYNIYMDIEERNDLSNQMPDLVSRFQADITRLRKEMPPARVGMGEWSKAFIWSRIPTENWFSGNIYKAMFSFKNIFKYYSFKKLLFVIFLITGGMLSILYFNYLKGRK